MKLYLSLKNLFKSLFVIVAIANISVLSGCDHQADESLSAQPVAAVAESKTSEANFYAKPGASVDLASNQPIQMEVSNITVVNIELKTALETGRMHVNLNVAAPLILASELDEFDFDLNANGQYILPVTLMAEEEGRYYLNLQVDVTQGDQLSSRNMSVIIQVGSPKLNEPAVQQKPINTEDRVIELPAQETVIRDE